MSHDHRAPVHRRSSILVLALTLSIGCARPGDCRVASWSACDIRDTPCQERVLAAVQCDRGHELDALPPVRRITRDELRAELVASAATATPQPEWDVALSLLDLLPSGASAIEESIDARVASTVAYYSTETESITIVDRGAPMDLGSDTQTLAHELVHAIQDHRYDLDAFVRGVRSHDELDARRSVVEGDARFFDTLYDVRQRAIPLERVAWAEYYDSFRSAVVESIASSRAPYAQARLVLPYLLGASAIHADWNGAGDFLDETSPPRVDALYASPPDSVAELMDRTVNVSPLDCEAPEPPAGFEVVDDDALGPIGVLAFLAGRGQVASAWDVARGVRGDGIRIVRSGATIAVVWRIRVPRSGLPFAQWVAEDEPRREAYVDGDDVVLVAANEDGVAEAWTAAVACH